MTISKCWPLVKTLDEFNIWKTCNSFLLVRSNTFLKQPFSLHQKVGLNLVKELKMLHVKSVNIKCIVLFPYHNLSKKCKIEYTKSTELMYFLDNFQ